jgi:hypothetical protein
VRRALGTKKVDHAGTLDPMATGLLAVGVGRATRLLRFLGDLPKTYEGSLRLAIRTTTLDADGDTVSEAPAADVTDEALLFLIVITQHKIYINNFILWRNDYGKKVNCLSIGAGNAGSRFRRLWSGEINFEFR